MPQADARGSTMQAYSCIYCGKVCTRPLGIVTNEMIRKIPLPFRHCKVLPSGSRGLLGRLVLWLVVASLIPALYGILTHAHLPSFLCMYAVESSDVMRVEQANPPKSFNHLSL